MLGGLTNVKEPDERESIALLKRLQEKSGPAWGRSRCCDCGGGIGRVTRNVLMAFYDKAWLCVGAVQRDAKLRRHIAWHRWTLSSSALRLWRPVCVCATLCAPMQLSACAADCRRLRRRQPSTIWCGFSGAIAVALLFLLLLLLL